jgi:hypothetical protein
MKIIRQINIRIARILTYSAVTCPHVTAQQSISKSQIPNKFKDQNPKNTELQGEESRFVDTLQHYEFMGKINVTGGPGSKLPGIKAVASYRTPK